MSDAGGNGANAESPGGSKAHAPKDRNCPYCGQAFTSSSLGRHLDLYIKEKNPKPADGVHDVDAIRKMRSGITRRQPRGSLAARRDASTPGTPTGSTTTTRKSPEVRQQSAIPKDGQYVVDQSPSYPWQQPRWETTGVINDLPAKDGDPSGAWEENADQARRSSAQQQRAPSRMVQKQQLDARQKLSDAVDTARAAELALRELLSSWRAAKQQFDMNSLPFDFDPLALDFPALTLQCLQPPPTLFSSTPIPTSTSWSIQPPAKKQYDALVAYFQEEFKKWRQACAAATTATQEDLTYPPSQNHVPVDVRESVKRAEKTASNLEKQINEHLQSTFVVWEQLPSPRQQELWVLELARSVGRRQKDLEKAKQTHHSLKQESANLQSQIDQLNRLQQPREFKLMPPATIPFDQAYVSHVLKWSLEAGVPGGGVGVSMNDRHLDTSTVVQRAIERWKNVIVASRATGMNAQRPLDQAPPTSQPATTPGSVSAPTLNQTTSTPTPIAPSQPRPTQQSQQPGRQVSGSITNGPTNDSLSNTTANSTSAPNDEGSDEDADAEMEDDDSFAPISAPPVVAKPVPQQPMQKLQIPRARDHNQRNNAQFAMNGAGAMAANQRMNMARPMANMNPGGMQQAQNQQRAQQQAALKNDYGTAVQGLSNGEPMYMDG
ncbi:hypothetical protein SUNI508_12029 [Seiridium unicorne]|uniref:C2H2-type domain-containing protein n=1 Tax=Seiridium unicorne TaxID=138068 RepID=A0ABR2UFI2_9PEZI